MCIRDSVYLALLFLVPQVLKKVKKARTDESGEAEETEEEEDETELPSSGDMLLVHFLISDRNYQLIRVLGELRAYRVGGEFRGFDEALLQAGEEADAELAAKFYQAVVFKDMTELRLTVDEMETLTSRACWPYPSYGELMFSVR